LIRSNVRSRRALVGIMVGGTAGVLLQHRQSHGDVEPVQDMLGFRSDQLGQRAHLFAAVGQECHILIGL